MYIIDSIRPMDFVSDKRLARVVIRLPINTLMRYVTDAIFAPTGRKNHSNYILLVPSLQQFRVKGYSG